MPLAILDAIEDFAVHERLAQADQHHVLGAASGFLDEPREDRFGHVLFGLLVRFAGTHRAVEIALSRRFDDVLYRQSVQRGFVPQVSPQQFGTIPGAHDYELYCSCTRENGHNKDATFS